MAPELALLLAIESAVARGDKGILITPSGDAVVPALDAARAAGLYTIALDTPPNPATAVDITFATDNYLAGQLIGQWTAATLNGDKAVIAMLDLFNDSVVSVDYYRDQGFLNGMGIVDAVDTSGNGNEPPTPTMAVRWKPVGIEPSRYCLRAMWTSSTMSQPSIRHCSMAMNPLRPVAQR